ncbi:MAG TPA: c-type cytochrome, partial [Anaerolineae bacterium]|nr:c-type cytochrome [Anaerolineae bacterium]
FFPDIIFKDVVVSLSLFALLLGLVVFVGVPQEPPANPADTRYVPTPEWYFLFLYQFLKYFPGSLEVVATTVVPLAGILALLLLPLYDVSRKRHPKHRPVAVSLMSVVVVAMVLLTVQAVVTKPEPTKPTLALGTKEEAIAAGAELYAENCAECHGEEGEGGENQNSPGEFLNPINSDDFLLTRDDETIYNIIAYGQPDQGMSPYGVEYGGKMSKLEIDAIIAFIRSWQAPPEEEAAAVQALAAVEHPSFSQHIQPLLKKRCFSCHGRRKKGNYLVTDYDSVMHSGDHAPTIIPGDVEGSIMVHMLRGEKTEAGKKMPPSRPLRPEQIQAIERWIADGAPNN